MATIGWRGEAVALLDSVARKGRSYGIHLILASQSAPRRGSALREARLRSFGQFPVRIALPGGADVLDSRNNAADSLRLGTAIVNTAGGFGGPANASRAHERLVEFPDPHAEPKTLSTLRKRLWLARDRECRLRPISSRVTPGRNFRRRSRSRADRPPIWVDQSTCRRQRRRSRWTRRPDGTSP